MSITIKYIHPECAGRLLSCRRSFYDHKVCVLTLIICFFCSLALSQNAISAREYYEELYRVGGLDNFADEYVCFHDNPELSTFFIIGRSDPMMQLFKDSGEWQKMPKGQRADLERGFLMRVGYNKGLANGMEYMNSNPTHDSYTEDIELPGVNGSKGTPMRINLQINWDTLRYRNTITKRGSLMPAAEDTGKCEIIPSSIRQHGHKQ